MNKTRPSLGGKKPSVDTASLTAAALSDMAKLDEFTKNDSRDYVLVSASDINKTFNARFIPCSFEEFSNINWPDLSLPVDEASELYPDILKPHKFYDQLSQAAKNKFLSLLSGVHTTAQGIVANTQIQPITLERESPETETYYLVDGERRTLAVLYSKGKIPRVRATVFNSMLSDLARAKIKDLANSSLPLTLPEQLESKRAIYTAIANGNELTIRDLTGVLGFGKSQCAILKKAFDHPKYTFIVERIANEGLGWRELATLVNDPEAKFVESTELKDPNAKVKPTPRQPSGDIVRLQETLSNQVGFPSTIKFAEKSKKVTVSLTSTLDQFGDLLEAMKRIKPNMILEDFDGLSDGRTKE